MTFCAVDDAESTAEPQLMKSLLVRLLRKQRLRGFSISSRLVSSVTSKAICLRELRSSLRRCMSAADSLSTVARDNKKPARLSPTTVCVYE